MKQLLQKMFHSAGYAISRIDKIGVDPFNDMAQLLPPNKDQIVFDVGANIGQSVKRFRKVLPVATIHSFEPSPSVFLTLQANVRSDHNVYAWNFGLGAIEARQTFFENDQSVMSSFLSPGEETWVQTINQTEAEVKTLDSFCGDRRIEQIDVLKSDTQGYDLEVLRGAQQYIQQGRVKLIYLEINFADIYAGQGTLGQEFDLLVNSGFRLLSFYSMYRKNGLAAWTDALFIHHSIIETLNV